MRHVFLALLFIILAVGAASLVAAIIFFTSGSEHQRKKLLNEFLSTAKLQVDNETWSALMSFTARRARWGAIGAGIGFAVSLPLGTMIGPSQARWESALGVTTLFGGLAVASALSSQMTVHLGQDVSRVAFLQPHSLSDYLPRRVIVAEVTNGLLGLVAFVCGQVLLWAHVGSASTAVVGAVLGLGVCAVSVLAMLLQRRLLRSPARAQGLADLVTHDVLLAMGLRDLAGVPLSTSLMCGYGFLLWADVPSWVPHAFLLTVFCLAYLLYGRRPQPIMVPVAQQLTPRAHVL
jgi:hypothetical protein